VSVIRLGFRVTGDRSGVEECDDAIFTDDVN